MMKDIVNKIATFIIKIVNFNGSFIFRNNYYSYFIHERSWATERVVEIPIILKYIDKNKRTLEVGNVLSQFVNTKWDIVDKFEFGKDIINEDIIDFKPNEKYDLIISISTLEHIGFNEDVGGGEKPEDNIDKGKIIDAINNLKTNIRFCGEARSYSRNWYQSVSVTLTRYCAEKIPRTVT